MTDDWRANFRESRSDGVAKPRIEAHPDKDGVQLVDPIEQSEFTLVTPHPVDPVKCDTDGFYFPVDTAGRIASSELSTLYKINIWVRDARGNNVIYSEGAEDVSAPDGRYNIELSSAHMKVYLLIDGDVSISSSGGQMTISSTKADTITIGLRSFHDRPAGTITTTEKPEDMMHAISSFGSALKTTTCERSYPTLRGHPPLLELGNSVSIPSSIEAPETNITIRIPPTLEYIFPVTSLAYYLGANVEPAESPHLLVDGKRYSLTDDGGFEETVERILKHVFVMDCLTRTEGYYEVDLHERNRLADQISLDFPTLYQMETAEQVKRYLSVPFTLIEQVVPDWKLTADVVPNTDHATTLPYLADELAIVRCPSNDEIKMRSPNVSSKQVTEFFDSLAVDGSEVFARGETEDALSEPIFQPESSDSVEHVYIGEGIPLGTGKMTPEAFHQRSDSDFTDDVETNIVVICNDPSMASENIVSKIYDGAQWLNTDVSVSNQLSVAEVAEVLGQDIDFLHYVGHVDENGLKCSDGYLDTQSLESVAVRSFLLNACNSYLHGKTLVERGARGGVATLSNIANEAGVKFGTEFACLLSRGFPLGQALHVLSERELANVEYLTIGDPTTQIIGSRTGGPHVCRISGNTGDDIDFVDEFYFTSEYGLGSMVSSQLSDSNEHYLSGNNSETNSVCSKQLETTIDYSVSAVIVDGEMVYSNSSQEISRE